MTLRRFTPGKQGRIEVVTGCMFSGKSGEAIRRAKSAMHGRQRVVAFKHKNDSRYHPVELATHCGARLMGFPVDSIAEMQERVMKNIHVIVIDEAQFFPMELVDYLIEQRNIGRRVIVSGLNMDFAGRPFAGPMPGILSIANHVSVRTAVCTVCGAPAYYSQRLTDSITVVDVGEAEKYAARCMKHWNRGLTTGR